MEKSLMVLGLIALLGAATFMMAGENLEQKYDTSDRSSQKNQWLEWKAKHSKIYNSQEEEIYRFGVFMKNVEYINANQGETYKLGTNHFSDLTSEEWKSLYLVPKGVIKRDPVEELTNAIQFPENYQAPNNVTWVGTGMTNTVLNQGQCGSCWAFSTVESINSAYAVTQKVSPIPNLSEQQVVSCSVLYGNLGCNGGNVVPAYKYVMAHPLTTDAAYPYTSGSTSLTGFCQTSLANQGTWKVSSYNVIPAGSCSSLQNSISQQPTSVCVAAETWQSYSSGIFTNCPTSNQIDHCVLAVGYVEGSYWLIQNQWTTQWGE